MLFNIGWFERTAQVCVQGVQKLLTDCSIGESDIDNFFVFFGKNMRKNQLRTELNICNSNMLYG